MKLFSVLHGQESDFFFSLGRGGMGSKIDAATNAVAPGSKCSACVVAAGTDLNSIRAVFGPDTKFGEVGTLFVTPGSSLEEQAIKDEQASAVRFTEFLLSCFLTSISSNKPHYAIVEWQRV